jgi:hypothetical protein
MCDTMCEFHVGFHRTRPYCRFHAYAYACASNLDSSNNSESPGIPEGSMYQFVDPLFIEATSEPAPPLFVNPLALSSNHSNTSLNSSPISSPNMNLTYSPNTNGAASTRATGALHFAATPGYALSNGYTSVNSVPFESSISKIPEIANPPEETLTGERKR